MGWVSKKVYAILASDEEGKKILEGIGEKDQDTVDKEVDAFFNKTGQSNPDKGKQSANPKNEEQPKGKEPNQPKQEQAKASDEVDDRKYLDITDQLEVEDVINELGYSDAVEFGDGLDRGKIFADETTLNQIQRALDEEGYNVDIKGGVGKTEEKPLHIRSLEKQVAGNPRYRAIADLVEGPSQSNDAIKELYFYAFKDAYEKNGDDGYINEDTIDAELGDAYYREMDNFMESRGMSQREFDRYGINEFEEEFGTEEDFTNRGKQAWRKYMEETYGGRFGGIDEDAQRFGNTILNNPEKFRSPEDIKKFADEFFYSGDEDAELLTKKWSERLFGNEKKKNR